jgi:hypothetical protein
MVDGAGELRWARVEDLPEPKKRDLDGETAYGAHLEGAPRSTRCRTLRSSCWRWRPLCSANAT